MGRALKKLNPDQSAQHRFGAELRRLRISRNLSQVELGRLLMHSGSTVAKIEKAERWPSSEFAERADEVLGGGGKLLELLSTARRERAIGLSNVRSGITWNSRSNSEASARTRGRCDGFGGQSTGDPSAPGSAEATELDSVVAECLAALRSAVEEHPEGEYLTRHVDFVIDVIDYHFGGRVRTAYRFAYRAGA
ncbi:helix-turn-helix domain-containing protein [Nocardia beijingensis]|uniref:helix-turn-helix domain-containing protein n=1 Tax=Nocardia beijingensis TaxID=95162 RepID=UPI000B3283E1|nr:helix-turn-helix transcriptional regulator [Nocardia beijingensis]